MPRGFFSSGGRLYKSPRPNYWVDPVTGRSYGQAPRVSFPGGRMSVQQQIAMNKYKKFPTISNFNKLKSLGAMIVFGAMDYATINSRNNFIFPNSKMYSAGYTGGLYTYKRAPRASVPSTTKGKKSTNQRHKSVRASRSKKRNQKKIVSRAVKRNPVVKGLTKQIFDLNRKVNVGKAKHTFKGFYSSTLFAAVAQANHGYYNLNTLSMIETAMANFRYYDPAVPGTLVTANASTGTYSRDVMVNSIYSKIECANNYQVPCNIKIYLCSVKGQTDNTPTALLAANDQVIGGSAVTNPHVFLSEIESIKDQWSIDCVVDKLLYPGQFCTAKHAVSKFQYDPAHSDGEAAVYQKKFKSFVWVIRIEGVLGHDTAVATEQTTLSAAIDIQYSSIMKFEYEAGVQLNDIYISENRDTTFTNGGVVSSKPVSDNIGYSVA